MVDLTLPQTAYIKKLKPYLGETPSYVQAMDCLAEAAGLTVRRLQKRDSYRNEIFSIYAGSRKQIAGCALLIDAENANWPRFVRHASRVSIACIDAYGWGYLYSRDESHRGNICLIAEDRYCIMVRHNVPEASCRASDGVERFEFLHGKDDELIAYVGTKEALLQGKFVPAKLFPDDSTEEGRGEHVKQETVADEPYADTVIAELERAIDGLWIYRTFPRRRAADRRRKAENELQNLDDYANPQQWLEHEEGMIVKWVRVTLSGKFLSCKTRSGMRFSMSEAHAAEVLSAIEVAAQRIRTIPVKITRIGQPSGEEESSDVDRAALADAEVDSRFQRFMQSALMRPADPNALGAEA